MAKCGDCLYFGFCEKYIEPEETFPEIGGCHTFKSKDAFVEVVRCKDCQFFDKRGYEEDNRQQAMPELDFGWCSVLYRTEQACNFCSSGERREGE